MTTEARHSFDVEAIRKDFPCLQESYQGKPLIYLDNAATSQKPQSVLDVMQDYYQHKNANVHRAVHPLAERATVGYEQVREKIKTYINASTSKEVIFTRGTTESINLVAQSFGGSELNPGDEIILSHLEHHSNIVPWQLIAEKTGATIKVIDMRADGSLELSSYHALLNQNTKIVAISHISNALGTINPIKEMIQAAHDVGAKVLIDGAQAVPHMKIDVKALDCDFYAFSSHKMFGPTGIGILYGKEALLDSMPPYQGGGEMIREVSFDKSTYNELPHKFEAGTPSIAEVFGLGAAIDYLNQLSFDDVKSHEEMLLSELTRMLESIPDVKIYGTSDAKAGVVSFNIDNIHAHDVGTILGGEGICVRVGHHCAMPIMTYFNVPATVRASVAMYNTVDDLNALYEGVLAVKRMFQ